MTEQPRGGQRSAFSGRPWWWWASAALFAIIILGSVVLITI